MQGPTYPGGLGSPPIPIPWPPGLACFLEPGCVPHNAEGHIVWQRPVLKAWGAQKPSPRYCYHPVSGKLCSYEHGLPSQRCIFPFSLFPTAARGTSLR